jgi:ribosomal protein S18 acetylase RimI-like enzyme
MTITEVHDYSDSLLRAANNLLAQLTTKKPEISISILKEIIRSENTVLFIAENDGEILGMLTLITIPIPTGIRCIIEDVVVDNKLRGKGAGQALMQAAEKKAKERGCENINLTSSPERAAANALYKKLGFEIRETNVHRKILL